jgi:hypothetical protein
VGRFAGSEGCKRMAQMQQAGRAWSEARYGNERDRVRAHRGGQ